MEKAGAGGGKVVSVSMRSGHDFSKRPVEQINIVQGLGVDGDAHMGARVQHLSRVKADPAQPNLRQVHLIHSELFDELNAAGFSVKPADLGENVTTSGINLLDLPRATVLHIGEDVRLEVTGLRNPCHQIEKFQKGLLAAVLDRDADGKLIRKAGIMTIVLAGGIVKPGDSIQIELPPEPHAALERV